ncbi:TetR/AcrR family transcriptional regulator [Spirillospora sp. NPDC029432]|uniref:TetR/AcrR family transcriptional regulator n=1 Tax=Spirillospora sp. NPDC029432 TaxID=3154599 RepID=UPI003456299C
MPERTGGTANRTERRKARTRAALIRAAQTFLAEGNLNAPILEITRTADVGLGTFYNHFDSREQLFEVAIEEALDRHGALLDEITAELQDPAEIFAQAFRLTGRLHRLHPDLSKVLLNSGLSLLASEKGLAPRAHRDIEAGMRSGRFGAVRDPDLALTVIGGSVLALGRLLHDQPERDAADATDRITEDLLRMLGLPTAEAAEICARPLPDLTAFLGDDKAA